MIDADELLDEICREQCERKFTDCDGMCEMAAVVVNAPTVDAVPVVRCKDCKNWIPGIITEKDEFIPPKCGKYQQMVGHGCFDFCSLAEKVETNGQD